MARHLHITHHTAHLGFLWYALRDCTSLLLVYKTLKAKRPKDLWKPILFSLALVKTLMEPMHTTTLHNKDLVVTGYLTKILWLTLSPVVRLSHTGVIDLHTNLSQVWLIKVSCSNCAFWLLHGLMSVKEYIAQEHCKRQEFIYYCPLIQFNRLCTSLCYLEWKYKQVQSPSKRGLKDISSQTRNSTATSFFFCLWIIYFSLKETWRWQCWSYREPLWLKWLVVKLILVW